jgi:hypothetical protein
MSSPLNNSTDTVSVLKRLGIFDLLVPNPTRHEEDRQKPEIVHTQERSHPVVGQRPQVSDRVRLRDESKLQGKPKALTQTQWARVGRRDSRSGRKILQPTQSPIENERLAAENAPKLETKLSSISASVPGARFERLRPQKNLQRLNAKIKEGKPAGTISDYLAAQVSAATPEAKDQLVREIKKEFPVMSVEDRFLKGRKDKAGYPSANVQVKLPNGGTSEVQIVPSEVQEITDQTHHLYKEGRNARDTGDSKTAKTAFAAANTMNRQAVQQFVERNNTKHAPVDSQSTRDHRQINPQARKRISKGQEVTLFGLGKATVLYVSPVMNIARVRLASGKQRPVRLSQIKEQ